MNRHSASLIAVVLVSFGGNVAACEITTPLFDFNQRAKHSSDGSFQGGGADDLTGGGPASDLGSSKTLQIIYTSGGACMGVENVLIVDCATSEKLVLTYWPKANMGELSDATPLLPPDGFLKDLVQGSLPDMQATAVVRGALVDDRLLVDNANSKKRDRFDPMIGCKLFYPDSAGAQS